MVERDVKLDEQIQQNPVVWRLQATGLYHTLVGEACSIEDFDKDQLLDLSRNAIATVNASQAATVAFANDGSCPSICIVEGSAQNCMQSVGYIHTYVRRAMHLGREP